MFPEAQQFSLWFQEEETANREHKLDLAKERRLQEESQAKKKEVTGRGIRKKSKLFNNSKTKT